MPSKSRFIVDTEGWKTLSSETHYQNKNLEVVTQTVLTPSRGDKPAHWTVVHRKAAVVIAPVLPDGTYLLIKQERIPVRQAMWEFPAGQIDEEDTTDEKVVSDTAARELKEETGYVLPPGGEMVALGFFFTSQGFTDEHNHLFLARGVVMSTDGTDNEGEGITNCQAFSAGELRRMVAENEIINGNTLSLYARLCARGLI
jgi:8-oxo-dGTP pyrophosphatase MutT (NUDIX family)